MRARRIQANFQGQDGSVGFRKNHTYDLTIKHQGGEMIVVEHNDIRVEYQSVISFLDNWTKVIVVDEPKFELSRQQDYGSGKSDFR